MILSSLPCTLKIFLDVIAALAAYQILIRIIRKLDRFPAPAFIGRVLDSDQRRCTQRPTALVRELEFNLLPVPWRSSATAAAIRPL